MTKENLSQLTTRLGQLPFDVIKPDPAFIPEILEHKEIKPDAAVEDKFFKLMTETGYVEPLRVCLFEGQYLLLPSYENYKAREKMLENNRAQLVDCIIVEGGTQEELLLLSCRLNLFSNPSKPHLNRLITLDLLYEVCGFNIKKLKKGMGISETNAVGKRQLQKDLRLIQCPELLSRVIGVDLCKEGEEKVPLIKAIVTPQNTEIDMTASQADQLLTVSRKDKKIIKKALEAYDDERERLNKYYANPELVEKPLYQWKPHFSFKKMLQITENIAQGQGYSSMNNEDMLDQEWALNFNEFTGEMKLPELKFNAYSKNPKDIKLMQDAAFVAKKLYTSLAGHLNRIRPEEHGQLLKVAAENINPLIETPPNKIDLNDLQYIKNFIQKDKMLYYCNRRRFLNILELKPIYFGFKTSRWDETTTYKEAKDRWENWRKTKFEKQVQKWHKGNPDKHPSIKFYIYINNFLNMNCKTTIDKNTGEEIEAAVFNINFSDFFNDLFSYVLDKIDEDKTKHEQSRERLRKIERNLTGQSWDEINKTLEQDGTISLNREQLESILHQRQNAVAANIAAQNRKLDEQQALLEQLIYNPLKTNQDDNEERLLKYHPILMN